MDTWSGLFTPSIAGRIDPYWQSNGLSQHPVFTGSGAIEVVGTLFVTGGRPRPSMSTLRLGGSCWFRAKEASPMAHVSVLIDPGL
jgi:hypothetical protein